MKQFVCYNLQWKPFSRCFSHTSRDKADGDLEKSLLSGECSAQHGSPGISFVNWHIWLKLGRRGRNWKKTSPSPHLCNTPGIWHVTDGSLKVGEEGSWRFSFPPHLTDIAWDITFQKNELNDILLINHCSVMEVLNVLLYSFFLKVFCQVLPKF